MPKKKKNEHNKILSKKMLSPYLLHMLMYIHMFNINTITAQLSSLPTPFAQCSHKNESGGTWSTFQDKDVRFIHPFSQFLNFSAVVDKFRQFLTKLVNLQMGEKM